MLRKLEVFKQGRRRARELAAQCRVQRSPVVPAPIRPAATLLPWGHSTHNGRLRTNLVQGLFERVACDRTSRSITTHCQQGRKNTASGIADHDGFIDVEVQDESSSPRVHAFGFVRGRQEVPPFKSDRRAD